MNTVEELVNVYGIHESTAQKMIKDYSRKIGSKSGDFEITDITYQGLQTRDIEMTCTSCGKVVHKDFAPGRNKWSELRKHCECKEVDSKNFKKIKKTIRNDAEEYKDKIYGSWKVIDFFYDKHKKKSGSTVMWRCKCIVCGYEIQAVPADIKNNRRVCQCNRSNAGESYKTIVGAKYNRLTILEVFCKQTGKTKTMYAKCKCDCGNVKDIQVSSIKSGKVKSCGCYSQDVIEMIRASQKVTDSPLYSTWNSMKQRCYNKNSPSFKDYGGRGITICDEWLGENGFKNFETWSIENGYRPNIGLSIDRIDVNKAYSPDNCRWTTIFVQSVNKRVPAHKQGGRKRKLYEINGVSKSKAEWCKEYGVWDATVNYRMKNMGMSLEEALTAEKKCEGNHHPYTINLAKDKEKAINDLNKIKSYIECNFYLKFTEKTQKYILEPQYRIDTYRVDFLVGETNIVVECDGYEYHKTKEQLDADCKRHRKLTLLGYDIVRFSGSEINSDCEKCVNELIQIVESRAGKNESTRASNY